MIKLDSGEKGVDRATVSSLTNRDGYIYIGDQGTIEKIKALFGSEAEEYGSYYVRIGQGEPQEVWGVRSNLPYLWAEVNQIRQF